jgi:hypothetical protein
VVRTTAPRTTYQPAAAPKAAPKVAPKTDAAAALRKRLATARTVAANAQSGALGQAVSYVAVMRSLS